ncbi:hypothetical protein R1flu_006684 [Riccia fluitans]|uniref:VQ domain-containing protein n=1 Tax=Riccia fluitans TaxID=41844 RepID=A0ABD1YX19_9MARC
MSSDLDKKKQSALNGLTRELRQRSEGKNFGSAFCSSSSPSSESSASRLRLLEQLRRASEAGNTSRASKSMVEDHKDVELGQMSLPTPQSTPPPPPTEASLRSGSTLTSGAGGAVKKRRIRPSRKPRTTVVAADTENFFEIVQKLTAPPLTDSTQNASDSAVVRPLPPHIFSAKGESGRSSRAGKEVAASTSMPSLEPTEVPGFVFQGTEGAGGMNDMMGYIRQSSWMAMESTFSLSSESIQGSRSTQFAAAAYPSGTVKASVSPYKVSSHSEEVDVSKEA